MSFDGTSTTKTTERYELDPYGANEATYDDGYNATGGSYSIMSDNSFHWYVLHQGLFQDGVSGLYCNRAREFDPAPGVGQLCALAGESILRAR